MLASKLKESLTLEIELHGAWKIFFATLIRSWSVLVFALHYQKTYSIPTKLYTESICRFV